MQAAASVGEGGHDHSQHSQGQGAIAPAHSKSGALYTCSMHPWVVLPEPGQCPICRMDLVPIDPSRFTGELAIDPAVTQRIGVRVSPVVEGPVVRRIRTVATIEADESLVRTVSLKAPGWIQTLHVSREGDVVRAGEPLLTLDSPQLQAAQGEYLAALGAAEGPMQRRLLDSARDKLLQLGMTAQQIEALAQRGAVEPATPFLSPFDGYVLAVLQREGAWVDPGRPVVTVADLSRVWAVTAVYEPDLPFVRVGDAVELTLAAQPGEAVEGVVEYVYPTVDPLTRQGRVRIALDNPQLRFRPGQYAVATIRARRDARGPLAPRSAIVRTGARAVAFVQLGEGRFEPRQVTLGAASEGDLVEVLEGLRAGEQVVTNGQFLLDSEARLRESIARMLEPAQAEAQPRQDHVEAPDSGAVATLDAAALQRLTQAVEAAAAISQTLAGDVVEGLAERAASLETALRKLAGAPALATVREQLTQAAQRTAELRSAATIERSRAVYAQLSASLATALERTGLPPALAQRVELVHCPMYNPDEGGAWWLQRAGDVKNPYMGAAMLRCHDRRQAIPAVAASSTIEPAHKDSQP